VGVEIVAAGVLQEFDFHQPTPILAGVAMRL
jgi:hypothetical protein